MISFGFFFLVNSFLPFEQLFFTFFTRTIFLMIWSPCHILISKHTLSKYFSTSASFLAFYFLLLQHMHLRSKRILWDFLVEDLFSDLSIKSLWFSRFINFFFSFLFLFCFWQLSKLIRILCSSLEYSLKIFENFFFFFDFFWCIK